MGTVTKILIANRGEIVERVQRTAHAMGIPTVVVFTEPDRQFGYVREAAHAVRLDGLSPADSYLDMEQIFAAAEATGADAIHPGYGFLSENADFARACAERGLTFIGPSADAIERMGDKAQAKRAMIAAGVPCVPGFQDDAATDAQLVEAANGIGTPLMVKAAAGGGGRGMRRVADIADLPDAIASARSEALNAFGSGELILEKLVEDARHVEVQVFGDAHGHIIHLGERDCSVQRRHQKVIEEAPCPVMDESLRAEMGAAAVRAARAVDYEGAGTVEFLLGADREFYFLEMNTRLQVEHPVTEEVTGLDLVEMQIRVARGEPLGLEQSDIRLDGHSIEARIYAEDPANGFLPQAGGIDHLDFPARVTSGGVRTDMALPNRAAAQVPSQYDPMIAKVIVHADTRAAAIAKLDAALSRTLIAGVETNRDFVLEVLRHPVFADGEATTGFLDAEYADGYSAPSPSREDALAAADALVRSRAGTRHALAGWSNWPGLTPYVALRAGEDVHRFRYRFDGDAPVFTDEGGEAAAPPADRISHALPDGRVAVAGPGGQFVLLDVTYGEPPEDDAAGSGVLRAPMHGALLSVDVKEGDTVEAGQRLGTLEAMKMQHPLRADVDGTVAEVRAGAGTQIASGDVILVVEPSGD